MDYAQKSRMSSAKPLHSHTTALTDEQAEVLRGVLACDGYDFEQRPYMKYFARGPKLTVAVYEKGPKAVIQGRGIEDFVTLVLEPRVLGEARMGYEEETSAELYEPHFGIDESGKGDFFGPLVIAGAYVNPEIVRILREAGVKDSKAISSDKRIRELAAAIRKARVPTATVVIAPPRYNDLYRKIGNLNRLLAWGHARVIEDLCKLCPDCPRALSDKFADARLLERSLMQEGRKLKLEQRTKAESDYAVAAASILAREKFIDWLDQKGAEVGVALPRGVSKQVKDAALALIKSGGGEVLESCAKTHFKTAAEVLAMAG
jgi:ribonuclease HIII